MTGWVLSYRSKWTHPVFRNLQEAGVWAWMCETAVWEDTKVRFSGHLVSLKRGQLITSRRFVSQGFGMGEQVTRSLFENLEKEGMINLQTNPQGTIITICNYEEYQGNEKQLTHQLTSSQPTGNPPTNPNKKQRNNINKLNKEYISDDFEEFWKECPRKVGKGAAQTQYTIARKEISAEELKAAMIAHAKAMTGKDVEFIPHPRTWLSQKRYYDENRISVIEQEKKDWPQWKTKLAAHLGDHAVKGWFNTATLKTNTLTFTKKFEFTHVKQQYENTLQKLGITEIVLESEG